MYSCYFNEASVLQTSVETVHTQQAGVRAGAGHCRPRNLRQELPSAWTAASAQWVEVEVVLTPTASLS